MVHIDRLMIFYLKLIFSPSVFIWSPYIFYIFSKESEVEVPRKDSEFQELFKQFFCSQENWKKAAMERQGDVKTYLVWFVFMAYQPL